MSKRQIKFRAWDETQSRMVDPFELGSMNAGDGYEGYFWTPMQFTGLKDREGKDIYEGDIVSLDGNMTADDSLGLLPNGWHFDESDKYAVEWDEVLAGWALRMETKADSAYNAKYLNHARSLLVDKGVTIVGNIYEHPALLATDQEHVSEIPA